MLIYISAWWSEWEVGECIGCEYRAKQTRNRICLTEDEFALSGTLYFYFNFQNYLLQDEYCTGLAEEIIPCRTDTECRKYSNTSLT